jgi:hypothetical protein
MSEYVGKESAMIALILVGMGMPAEASFNYAQKISERLDNRSVTDVLSLEDLQELWMYSP